MSRTRSAIWVHVLWSTRSERPMLSADIQPVLLDHLRMTAQDTDIHIGAVNAVADHVHAVLRVIPRMSLADAVNRLKGESAHWINTLELTPTHFAWEPSYIGCSVSPADLPNLCRYVHEQYDVHLQRTYAEEARALLSPDPSTLWHLKF